MIANQTEQVSYRRFCEMIEIIKKNREWLFRKDCMEKELWKGMYADVWHDMQVGVHDGMGNNAHMPYIKVSWSGPEFTIGDDTDYDYGEDHWACWDMSHLMQYGLLVLLESQLGGDQYCEVTIHRDTDDLMGVKLGNHKTIEWYLNTDMTAQFYEPEQY